MEQADTPDLGELPTFEQIHHLKLPVSDLDRSAEFYGRALGAVRRAEFDHFSPSGVLFAYILEVPGLGTWLELRHLPDRARTLAGFDPITLQVADREALARWMRYFDAQGIAHSGILPGVVGWLLVFEDPDGLRTRFYTRERHGPEIKPSTDRRWLELVD